MKRSFSYPDLFASPDRLYPSIDPLPPTQAAKVSARLLRIMLKSRSICIHIEPDINMVPEITPLHRTQNSIAEVCILEIPLSYIGIPRRPSPDHAGYLSFPARYKTRDDNPVPSTSIFIASHKDHLCPTRIQSIKIPASLEYPPYLPVPPLKIKFRYQLPYMLYNKS